MPDAPSQDGITLTMCARDAERLRSFLQHHNAGQTNVSDVYRALYKQCQKLGISGREDMQWGEDTDGFIARAKRIMFPDKKTSNGVEA